jgi:hypothetical protein
MQVRERQLLDSLAVRHGPDHVLEKAGTSLGYDVEDVGRMAMHFRRMFPEWEMDGELRRSLAMSLLQAGVAVRWVTEYTGLGKSRVYELRRELNELIPE